MTKIVPFPEAKEKLEKLVFQAEKRANRFVITLKGKPVAGLVSISDLETLEKTQSENEGLISVVGKWADFEEIDREIQKVVKNRKRDKGRAISF